MNPGSADEALNSLTNVDIGWKQQIYAAQTTPPDPGRSSSTTGMEVINIVNNAVKTKPPEPGRSSGKIEMDAIITMNTAIKSSRRIATTGIDIGAMGVCGSGLGTKSELEMQRVADSLVNRVHATPVTTTTVPRSTCNLIISNFSESANTSTLHKFSSAFGSGNKAVAAPGGLCRAAGVVKVKKKRVRPSRRLPTTMVKTDTTNFKAMVEQFTGISPTCNASQESTASPSAAASSRQTIRFPFLTKPLPHPVLSKLSNLSAPAPTSAHPKE